MVIGWIMIIAGAVIMAVALALLAASVKGDQTDGAGEMPELDRGRKFPERERSLHQGSSVDEEKGAGDTGT